MPKPLKRFTKIRHGKTVAIEWTSEKTTAGGAKEHVDHQLECPEGPRPSFKSALQGFAAFFLAIIGAPKEWEDKTVITGVSINYEDDGRRGIILTASRKCPYGAAPVAMNTPLLKESMDPAKETGPTYWLPKMEELVAVLEQEAEAYLNGDRAQVEMFDGAPVTTEDKPKTKRKGGGGEPTAVGDVVGSITPKAGEKAAGAEGEWDKGQGAHRTTPEAASGAPAAQ